MQNTKFSRFLALCLAVILLCSLVSCQNGGTGDDQKDSVTTVEEKKETTAENTNPATIKIICDDTVTDDIWENPEILKETEYTFDGEVDAFTALTEIIVENNIPFVHNGGYVTGIGGLHAMDAGENSGWMFQVNGELASVGAQDYIIQDGDALVWFYTADYNTYFN